ncbi:MAG: HEAT repeat domain-containing protein [Planctomycetes bacterium]|nr:HEAT repeat domain-containing protein [Planctomycetota bacterium]
MLSDDDRDVKMAALEAAQAVLDQCRHNFETMNCVTGYVPGRRKALRATRIIGDALLVVLKDNDPELRIDAAQVVVSPVFRKLSDFDERAGQALPVLAEALSSENPTEREAVVQLLRDLYVTDAVPLLLQAVMDENVVVSFTATPIALTTISFTGVPSSQRQFAQSLVDRMWSQISTQQEKEIALVALGRIGGSRSVMLLLEELNAAGPPSREETRRRETVHLSLSKILEGQDTLDGLAAERDRLKVLMTSEPRFAAYEATWALVRIGPEGWAVIESAFEQSDARMQHAIARDLRNLGTDAIPDALAPLVSGYY